MRLSARPESRHYHGARPFFNPRERHSGLETRHSLSLAPLGGSGVLRQMFELRHYLHVMPLVV